MKLILASDLNFLLKYGYDLTGIPKNEMKIGYIVTASKAARDPSWFNKTRQTIKENGYDIEDFDIEGKTIDELRSFFKDKNIIHIEGGNTFYLLKTIRETGFGVVLKELLDEGKVYIGTSAGAYIMCPTIEVANWNDNGRDRFGMTDFTALNYVPFVLKVHYKDDMEEKIIENKKSLKFPIKILRDGQGLLVENDKYSFFGDGPEVMIQ